MSDTIAAVSTLMGRSAIGILRMSGDDAVEIASRVFRPDNGKALGDCGTRRMINGALYGDGGEVIDQCVAVFCRAPHSYTGENTVELQCHGSPTVLTAGLRSLFAAGARQATRGEFTKRAFLNGKLDLAQSEAVIDLIDAETEEMMRNAAAQLGGAMSGRMDAIYSGLTDIMSHFHAVIDYPDEEIEPFELENVINTLGSSAAEISRLLKTFERGRVVREGVRCAIIGRPNAGKSSLLNALLGYDRAIVTDIPGTTRDTIEEKLMLGGVMLRIADTAGLRETGDVVERMGVERARAAAENAELIFALFDGSKPLCEDDDAVIEGAKAAKHAVAVVNKSDLGRALSAGDEARLSAAFGRVCAVSAKNAEGLDALEEAVADIFKDNAPVPSGEMITNERQAQALRRALEGVTRAKDALALGLTPDAVLTDVEEAMSAIGEITGRTVREDITARIFERFCVGK
ncbi:MAG: tRNA uridine-5-carboxymethylaminomethyl(34) synthesis GTPase MnmE [Clostridiales bacterium]|nr:tRNA uridine-5-carboxymethylaminomethyl(34) synthesis GTPase MnmE [Clostridiales bacterium]